MAWRLLDAIIAVVMIAVAVSPIIGFFEGWLLPPILLGEAAIVYFCASSPCGAL